MVIVRGDNATHQEPAEQTEQQLSHGPLGPVDGGQQVVDKVLKQRPVVLLSLLTATPETQHGKEAVDKYKLTQLQGGAHAGRSLTS